MRAYGSSTASRRLAGGVVGALLALSAVAAPAGAATQDALVERSDYTDTLEVHARDNVATAVAFSRLAFRGGADEVVLARDDGFADAFASGLLQSDRPLLLTPSDRLDPRTAMEVRRLKAVRVLVLGGEGAIAPAVLDDLAALGVPAERLSGATRVETAVAVAGLQAPTAETAVLARAWPADGEADTAMFVDAMVAGGWSAAHGWPVLLTGTGPIPDATVAYLERAGVRKVHVVGGRAAVSEAAAAQLAALGIGIARVSGPSRFDTGTEVARRRGDNGTFVLVDGEGDSGWAAGFAAAAYSARFGAPILPVSRAELPVSVAELLRGGNGRRGLVCGPGVPASVCHQAARDAGQVRRAEADLTPPRAGVLEGAISNPEGVAAITVIGCGARYTVQPDADGRFTVPLGEGGCRLTVRVEHTDGTAFDQAFTVDADGGGLREQPKAPVVPALPTMPEGGLGVPTGEDDDAPAGDADDEASEEPGDDPSEEATEDPDEVVDPVEEPTGGDPTEDPGEDPGEEPGEDPTEDPGEDPGEDPTEDPTEEPTEDPTEEPTNDPTEEPTNDPDPPDIGCQAVLCPGLPGGGGLL